MSRLMTAPHYIKWPGGKRRLATTIRELFGAPCLGRYIEPFMGSGAVFLERADAGEIADAGLSDINPALMAVHRAVKRDPNAVWRYLSEYPTDGDWGVDYYVRRDRFNAMKANGGRGPIFAALFLWLNRACFNGLYRENQSGAFNVPVGSYKRLSLPSAVTLGRASSLLSGARLAAASFPAAIGAAGPGDQVYCDPPYVPASDTASFVGYSKGGFTWQDHHNLVRHAAGAVERGATVVLSNADVPQVRELYTGHGFVLHEVQVTRSIGAKTRGKAAELLAVGRPG